MKFVFFYTNQTNGQDLLWGFVKNGHTTDKYKSAIDAYETGQALEDSVRDIENYIDSGKYDGAVSWNYFPAVSMACMKKGIPYMAWIFDSPLIHVYHYTAVNNCNYIFDFDKISANELKSVGINASWLPLGVNTDRLGGMVITDEQIAKYSSDISFVGSLYQKNPFNRAKLDKSAYAGHFDDLFYRQMCNWRSDILYSGVSDELFEVFKNKVGIDNIEEYPYINQSQLYVGFFLARKYAQIERREILNTLAQQYKVTLYNDKDDKSCLENVICRPAVEYERETPIVYFSSKVNLNMTLRSIRSGLPLRVFDIMGVGGFLLSNNQPEFWELYEPGKEMAVYDSMEELCDLAGYYLRHERERITIAMNGYRKTCAQHTINQRVAKMLEKVYGKQI